MSRPVAIVNPQAANGSAGRQWPRLAQLLGHAIGGFKTSFTTRRGEGITLAQRAVEEGADLVLSVGGDGTHNEVVNGLFASADAKEAAAALAVIPAGTGGDLRRSLGLPARPSDAIAGLASEGRRRIDVGRLSCVGPEGAPVSRLFLNVSSCGVSGKVVDVVNRSSKWMGGRLSFALGSARALAGYRDQLIELRCDDGPPRELPITTLAVANGQYFGGGMRVAPEASLSDGLLDVTVWSGFTLRDFTLKAPRLYDGSHLRLPGVESLRASSIYASSDERVLLELDGEQPGTLPAIWTVVPGGVWLRGFNCDTM